MSENMKDPAKSSSVTGQRKNSKTSKNTTSPKKNAAKKPKTQQKPPKTVEKSDQPPQQNPSPATENSSARDHKPSKIHKSMDTVRDSLHSLKDKFENIPSGEKISDEYEKVKKEAKTVSWLSDIKTAFRFFTRLPLPTSETETPMNAKALWAAPLVGIVIGIIGGLTFIISAFLGLPDILCASLSVTAMIFATGCFHEDAIADVADGLGGGWTKDQKLEIMKDSRIGTYGATALFLSLIIKIGAIASLSVHAHSSWAVILLLIASSSASRAAGVALLALLPPLTDQSSGREAGSPGSFTLILALLIGSLVSVFCLSIGFGFSAMLAGLAGAVIGGGLVGWIANRQIGGQTGDVAGTCQQVSENCLLLAALIALSV